MGLGSGDQQEKGDLEAFRRGRKGKANPGELLWAGREVAEKSERRAPGRRAAALPASSVIRSAFVSGSLGSGRAAAAATAPADPRASRP